jgi:hypothetical protein
VTTELFAIQYTYRGNVSIEGDSVDTVRCYTSLQAAISRKRAYETNRYVQYGKICVLIYDRDSGEFKEVPT